MLVNAGHLFSEIDDLLAHLDGVCSIGRKSQIALEIFAGLGKTLQP